MLKKYCLPADKYRYQEDAPLLFRNEIDENLFELILAQLVWRDAYESSFQNRMPNKDFFIPQLTMKQPDFNKTASIVNSKLTVLLCARR